MNFREIFFTAPDNKTSLFLCYSEPSGQIKANVLLTHGMGEHSARYLHVAEFFAKHGYRLCTYDLRGHGRSQGKRGRIGSYDNFLDDLGAVFEYYNHDGLPIFLYGHSLGGQIVLNFILARHRKIQGVILASPWLRLAFEPSRWKLFLAKIMINLWPSFTQHTGVKDINLSRDQIFLASMKSLDLTHRKISAHMFYEISKAAVRARQGAEQFTAPLLLIHGANDPVICVDTTCEFYKKVSSKDKTLKIYPDMLHETHNEINRSSVLSDIVKWLEDHVAT